MININLEDLKINIYNLKKLIREYEIIKLNLFNQLKNSCISWQDNNSLKFEDALVSEKNETELLIDNIKLQTNIFMKLYNSYSKIGNLIKINLNNKQEILYLVNDLILKVKYIEKQVNGIDSNMVYNLKFKLKNIKNNLYLLKKFIKNLYKRIEEIEYNLGVDLDKLEKIKINMFEV